MRLAELPAYLEMLAGRAGEAAIPAANRMGSEFEGNVRAALMARGHPRGTRTPAPPGEPPAMESGELALSVAMVPASTPVVATSSVSPHAPPRDWVQEYGLVIHARPGGRMTFWYDGPYAARGVDVPERSYMRSTCDRMVANGSLERAAADAFYTYMWG